MLRPRPITSTLIVLMIMILSVHLVIAQEESEPGEPITHIVQPGDNLYRVALRYGTSMEAIAQANNITNRERIFVGQKLTIPGLTVPDDSDEVVNPLIAGTPKTHIVQSGENLTMIAQKYGITLAQLMRSNGLTNPDRIFRGQELKVWVPDESEEIPGGELPPAEQITITVERPVQQAVPQTEIKHVVGYGETLLALAQRYKVSWQDIAQANNIANINHLYAGQVLTIPSTPTPETQTTTMMMPNNGLDDDLGILSAPITVVVPTPSVTQGKQLIVDLSDQMVFAFLDGELQYSVLGSTGLPATPTVQGDFKIYQRYDSQTMSGPGYYLPGVTWVQYFYAGYAFHTAYWHNNWGQPMSHGCVNLPEDAAKWLYDFATVGTAVRVQY